MSAKRITCQSPLHNTRGKLRDGRLWSDNLGTYDGPMPPPVVCNRCAYHDGIAAQPPTVDELAQTLANALGVEVPLLAEMLKAKSK